MKKLNQLVVKFISGKVSKKFLISFSLILLLHIQLYAQHNVVLIIADDIGTDYFGFYEDHADTVDVPNIRMLVNKGIRFKNGMSNPVCSSTRSSILTGRYGFRTGVGNIVGGPGGSGILDVNEISIPKLLAIHNSSIAKANIGKWHLHASNPSSNLLNPITLGYDHFEGPFIGQLPSYSNWTKYTNGVSSNVTNYATSENVNNAISWIKTKNNQPFFLWLAFNAPHSPLHLPPSNLHSYNTLSGTNNDIRNNPKPYFKSMLQALDTELGRLFDSLKAINRFDSTDFIFIGDNGNSTITAQISDTSRAKGTVYQYGVHVPFIISGPTIVNPGRASDALINTADIFATVLELFGYENWSQQIPSGKPVDSKSFLPVILNKATNIRTWTFTEMFKVIPDADDAKAIRSMDYKLINFDAGYQEFYNLSIDPLELNNLMISGMSSIDSSNYFYLCNELSTLTGQGNSCQLINGLENQNLLIDNFQVMPNPFNSFIHIEEPFQKENFKLFNSVGQVFYFGNNIQEQDFTYLNNGVYFLKSNYNVIKLIKAK